MNDTTNETAPTAAQPNAEAQADSTDDIMDSMLELLNAEESATDEENARTGDAEEPEDFEEGGYVGKTKPAASNDLLAQLLAAFGPMPSDEKYGVYQSNGREVRLLWSGADRVQADLAAGGSPDQGFGAAFVARWTGAGEPPAVYVTDPDHLSRIGASDYYAVYAVDANGADSVLVYEHADLKAAEGGASNAFAANGQERDVTLVRWTGGGRPPKVLDASQDGVFVMKQWIGKQHVGGSIQYAVYAVDANGSDALLKYHSGNEESARGAGANEYAAGSENRTVTLARWTGGGKPPSNLREDPHLYVMNTWVGREQIGATPNVLREETVIVPAAPAQTQRAMMPLNDDEGLRTGIKVAIGAAIFGAAAFTALHFAGKK